MGPDEGSLCVQTTRDVDGRLSPLATNGDVRSSEAGFISRLLIERERGEKKSPITKKSPVTRGQFISRVC